MPRPITTRNPSRTTPSVCDLPVHFPIPPNLPDMKSELNTRSKPQTRTQTDSVSAETRRGSAIAHDHHVAKIQTCLPGHRPEVHVAPTMLPSTSGLAVRSSIEQRTRALRILKIEAQPCKLDQDSSADRTSAIARTEPVGRTACVHRARSMQRTLPHLLAGDADYPQNSSPALSQRLHRFGGLMQFDLALRRHAPLRRSGIQTKLRAKINNGSFRSIDAEPFCLRWT